jgi:ubiquinone/menaquinone biosynthesis C-methylase UbiE
LSQKNTLLVREFSEESVRDSYSKVAWFYDLWSRLTERKAARRALEWADIQDGESILEVGVGTGIQFAEIVRRNPHGRSEGVELSPAMLERASKRLSDHPAEQYHLQKASAYDLPFPSNTYDILLSNYMMDLLPAEDFVPVLSEFGRVLKPEGRVVISAFGFGDKPYHRFWFWLAKHFPALLTGCRPVSLRESLTSAGFETVQAESISQNTFPSTIYRAVLPPID